MFKLPTPQELTPLAFPDLPGTSTFLQSRLMSNGLIPSSIHSAPEEISEGVLKQIIRSDKRDANGLLLYPAGVNLERFQRNPVVLYEHSMVIGRCIHIEKDVHTITAHIEYDLASELGREVYRMHKSGFLPSASVGSIPKKYCSVPDGVDCQEWELVEISKVGIPADPLAS